MLVQPYLCFEGRCDEALAFYKTALGAQQGMLMRFKDNPDKNMPCPATNLEKVMHAQFTVGESTLFASDGRCSGKPNFDGIMLSITFKTEAEAEQKFNALSAGGALIMPLTKTFFSPKFGMTKDKFGVHWMVLVEA